MSIFLKKHLLLISVFVTGACVLIVEVVAVRVLSPYYGNTIFTVSSVISVILAALSIGYYVGGKFADRHPSSRWFFSVILVSGLAILSFHFLGTFILPILSESLSLTSGPLISSVLLFLAPALLLGTLSPYAIKLQSLQSPEEGVGTVSGKVFFWSTFGSITGSLSAGFILIPHFGINYIFIAVGVALFLLGLIPLIALGLNKKQFIWFGVFAFALVLLSLFAIQHMDDDVLYSKDGVYEKISIYDASYAGRPIRVFQQDRSTSGAMFLDSVDPTDLVFDYTKYYAVYKIFKSDVQNALVIGGGAYSIPKALLAELPNATVDVSEIEPSLYDLAKQYFSVEDDPRLRNYAEDGRRLLRDSDKTYDLIFSDVYYSLYSIPAHFTTQEFFSLAKETLSDDGILITNLIGDLSRQQPSLLFAEIKTFRKVFPNSYFFAVEDPNKRGTQNIIFVGYKSDKKIDLGSPLVTEDSDPIVRSLEQKAIDLERYELSPYLTLTDDHAPVEHLTANVLERSAVPERMIDGKEMLASIDQQMRYGPRYMGSPGHARMKQFLAAEMEATTDTMVEQSWNYHATDGATYTLTNIIGRFNPTEKRRIILATHYDSKKFADQDLIYSEQPVSGANDSASGTAVLIELARALSDALAELNVGVDIVFFDGEEGDLNQRSDYSAWKPLGSTYFAEHLHELYGNEKAQSALVLDMVCDDILSIYKEQSSVQHAEAHVDSFWSIAQKIAPEVFLDEVGQTIKDDHTPLNSAGIPSFLLIDARYSPWHTTEDTLDKCSASSLEAVAHAVFEYVTDQ